MKSPPPSTYESRMKTSNLILYGMDCGRDDANGGNRIPTFFLPKGRAKDASHQLQALFDDQP